LQGNAQTGHKEGFRPGGTQFRVNIPPQKSLVGGFPVRKRVSLRVSNSRTVASTANTYTQLLQVAGNACAEPIVVPSVSTQPINWDDWALQYRYYICLGARIRVEVRYDSTSDFYGQELVLTNATAPIGAFSDDIAHKWSQTKVISSAQQPCVMEAVQSTMNFFGRTKKEILADSGGDYGAAVTSTPAFQWYWSLNANNTSGTVGFEVTTVVDYDIMFVEPQDTNLDILTRVLMLREKRKLAKEQKRPVNQQKSKYAEIQFTPAQTQELKKKFFDTADAGDRKGDSVPYTNTAKFFRDDDEPGSPIRYTREELLKLKDMDETGSNAGWVALQPKARKTVSMK
jgi:hypothetical protein